MSLNEVITGASINFGAMNKGNNRTVFRNPRGRKRYYSFFGTVASTGAFGGSVNYKYSEDGRSWNSGALALSESGDGVEVNPDFDIKINDDGSQLEIFVVANFLNDGDLKYRRGTIADTADTVAWQGSQETIDASINYEQIGGTYNDFQSVAIARTDNGRLVVAFTEDFNTMGKDYRLIKLITGSDDSNAPTWANETTVVDGSGNTNNQDKAETWVGLESFDSSFGDRILFYCRAPDTANSSWYDIHAYVYSWNGSSFTQEASDTSVSTGGAATGAGGLSGVIGTDDKCNLVFENELNDIDHVKFGTAGALGTPSESGIVTATDINACSIAINKTTNDLFVFYVTESDELNYKLTDDTTISWSLERSIPTGFAITSISSSQEDQAGALHLAFRV